MKGRLVAFAFAIALAVLAIGGTLLVDPASGVARSGRADIAFLVDPPAPEPDVPALTAKAVSRVAKIQAGLLVESSRLDPSFGVTATDLRPSLAAPRSGKPRVFPLLI